MNRAISRFLELLFETFFASNCLMSCTMFGIDITVNVMRLMASVSHRI